MGWSSPPRVSCHAASSGDAQLDASRLGVPSGQLKLLDLLVVNTAKSTTRRPSPTSKSSSVLCDGTIDCFRLRCTLIANSGMLSCSVLASLAKHFVALRLVCLEVRGGGNLLLPADGECAPPCLAGALGQAEDPGVLLYLQEVAAQMLLGELPPASDARILMLDEHCDVALHYLPPPPS